MKTTLTALALFITFTICPQELSDKAQIEATLNNYIDGFYQGDTTKLKLALKPRLYNFGYLKDKTTGAYKYYEHLNYTNALKLAQRIKDTKKTRTETQMRRVKVLEISNHIAAAKVTAAWGLDYVLLSKDNGKWMIEEVIWEGPFEENYNETPKTTTYYLIRHAEKDKTDKSNKDPHLTQAGKNRANKWATIFKDVKFDMVFSTNYNRTKQTALPTAKANAIDIKYYNPSHLASKEFIESTKGKTVLIVGHSNTTPMFTNRLLGKEKYNLMQEDNNSNLYIVTIIEDLKTATLLKLEQ